MLKLCGFHVSNYHNKVRLVLLEKGIAFDEDANCTPSQSEDYLARSPMGKVPYLEANGARLTESAVICEYLEDAYPQKPLLPRDPLERARLRELIVYMELHLELVVRRLYGGLFFGRPFSEQTKAEVERDLAKGVRAFKAIATFEPCLGGKELTLADCAAFVHLPLVSMASKATYGRDALEGIEQVKPYLAMLAARPAFARVNEDRKAAQAVMMARAKG